MKLILFRISSVGSATLMLGIRVLFVIGVASAQGTGGVNPPPALNLNIGNFIGGGGLLCTIVDYFFWVVITVSVIMVLWAAYVYVTAGDDTEKTSKARKFITYAAVGIVVALIANSLPNIVGGLFAGSGYNDNFSGGCSEFG